MLSRQQKNVTLRDKFVCPFCEEVPDKIRKKLEKGYQKEDRLYDSLTDHVANHVKSLMLMAVPPPDADTLAMCKYPLFPPPSDQAWVVEDCNPGLPPLGWYFLSWDSETMELYLKTAPGDLKKITFNQFD